MRADDVIVIDDEGDETQVDIPAPEAPPLTIKIEPEDIPQDPEDSDEPVLRRSTWNRMQRQLFSPTNKGQYHKAVGFAESGGGSRSDNSQDETPILTGLTEELESVLTSASRHGVIHTFMVMCHPCFVTCHPFSSTSPAPILDSLTFFFLWPY